MKKQRGFTLVEFLMASLIMLGIGGWIANIVKLAGSSFDPLTGMVVLRSTGIFVAPLGSILGFI
jgi:prepilin-type N-terminal cleavage/methylation domain-containing protein